MTKALLALAQIFAAVVSPHLSPDWQSVLGASIAVVGYAWARRHYVWKPRRRRKRGRHRG